MVVAVVIVRVVVVATFAVIREFYQVYMTIKGYTYHQSMQYNIKVYEIMSRISLFKATMSFITVIYPPYILLDGSENHIPKENFNIKLHICT